MRNASTFVFHARQHQRKSDFVHRSKNTQQINTDSFSKKQDIGFPSIINGVELTRIPTSFKRDTFPRTLLINAVDQKVIYEDAGGETLPDSQPIGKSGPESAVDPMDAKKQPKPPESTQKPSSPEKPKAPAPKALPTVIVGNFRTSGSTADSGENNCAKCPRELGIHTTDFKNGMELRGDITGHVADAEYDFKRTREGSIWHKVKGTWVQKQYDKAGTDDDSTNSDESLIPVNDHIYSEDVPGLGSNPGKGDADVKEAVLKGNFVEWVNVKVGTGSWTKQSNEFIWHSVSWIEKIDNKWQRKAGKNEIDKGNTTIGTGNP
jgi:hypothetical protein